MTKFVCEDSTTGHSTAILEKCHDMGIPVPPLPPAVNELASLSSSSVESSGVKRKWKYNCC